MRRKSKHEELRARAFGSEMDNEAEASKDIVCGGAWVLIGGFRGGEEGEVLVKLKVWSWFVAADVNWRGVDGRDGGGLQ